MKALFAFLSGLLFSIGLIVSGMTSPGNIVGFLDFFGDWKPALLFVMSGAVGVYAVAYPLVVKRRAPLFAPTFEIPARSKIDVRLIAGATAFGIGWGIAGFCPGPAVVALGSGAAPAALFMGALIVGIALYNLARPSSSSESDGPDSCG